MVLNNAKNHVSRNNARGPKQRSFLPTLPVAHAKNVMETATCLCLLKGQRETISASTTKRNDRNLTRHDRGNRTYALADPLGLILARLDLCGKQ